MDTLFNYSQCFKHIDSMFMLQYRDKLNTFYPLTKGTIGSYDCKALGIKLDNWNLGFGRCFYVDSIRYFYKENFLVNQSICDTIPGRVQIHLGRELRSFEGENDLAYKYNLSS